MRKGFFVGGLRNRRLSVLIGVSFRLRSRANQAHIDTCIRVAGDLHENTAHEVTGDRVVSAN